MNEQKNFIIAIVLTLAILIIWQYMVGVPAVEEKLEQTQTSQSNTSNANTPSVSTLTDANNNQNTNQLGFNVDEPSAVSSATINNNQAPKKPANDPRLKIESDAIIGSINLKGARIDDITLMKYRETVDPTSDNIILLKPESNQDSFYVEHGWVKPGSASFNVPTRDTVWKPLNSAKKLTPSSPVTLQYDNGEGIIFERIISLSDDYLFTITQRVINNSANNLTLYPYALVARHGTPEITGFYILHEGLIGVLGEDGLQEIDYDEIKEDKQLTIEGTGGWLGITDKYWAAAIIPDQNAKYKARFSENHKTLSDIYQTDYLLEEVNIPAKQSKEITGLVFSGAKKVEVIDNIETKYNARNFELMIDWGWFYFFTKYLFYAIEYCFLLFGNFGLAILLVTVGIKIIFFPLANKSYVSMSRMKKLQPQISELRERYKDDKVKIQQEMMKIYQKEKVNPMSGCLPVLIQIPVFFALYKVLFVTIEMRHAPFFGWIHDLAASDPTTILNLFGLIPWTPPAIIPALGVWPIIMGITMFVQMKMNPTPPDPIQAKIFAWMPIVFTLMLASFPAGLIIYWAWNNLLSVLQQYVIMKKEGVKVELFDNIVATFKRSINDDEQKK